MTVYRWALGVRRVTVWLIFGKNFSANRSWHVLAKRLQFLSWAQFVFLSFFPDVCSFLKEFEARRRWERQRMIYWILLLVFETSKRTSSASRKIFYVSGRLQETLSELCQVTVSFVIYNSYFYDSKKLFSVA